MTHLPYDEEPDFSAPIEPVRPSRARPWMAAISILLVVVVVFTGLAGFGLPLLFGRTETTVTVTVPTPGPSAGSATTAGDAAAQLAVIDAAGSFLTMDAAGGSVVRHDLSDVRFTFPAWSPDGSRIAVTGTGPQDSAVYVVSLATAGSGAPSRGEPVAIYRSPDRPAFYVYWTPNGRSLAFLTSAPNGSIDLRLAPADGTGEATIVRQGSPMYWAWVDDARLFVHAGGGTASFLGEVDPDGDPPSSDSVPLEGAGEFRAPVVSAGGRYRGYAGRGADRTAAVIVEPRESAKAGPAGAVRTEVKVLGPAALAFDPAGDRLAFVARAAREAPTADLPVGPLKVVDSTSGTVRTLLPGSVIAFFWAPDGRSIAALRLTGSGAPATAAGRTGIREASIREEGAASPGFELQLAFVDPEDGTVRSQRSIRLGDIFTSQVLPYFDQYALSHRIWSSDATAIALPVVASNGSSEIRIFPADGSPDSRVASGVAAFWRP